MILLALINIHHYFIDGCVWKISTPEVKKDLFRHLETSPLSNSPTINPF